MRIALVHKRLELGGGTERDLHRTAGALAALGHEVHVFCARARGSRPAGVVVRRVPVVPAGRVAELVSFAWFATHLVGREQWDVVVSFGRLPRQDVVRCGGGTHQAYLARMEAASIPVRGRSLYHRAVLALEARQFGAGGFRRVIAVSRLVKEEIVEGYGVPPEAIDVLYNGVDLERFALARREALGPAVRAELRIPAGAPVCLLVGSGFRRKGVDGMLELWRRSAPRGATLVIVGSDPRMARYRRLVEAAELRGRVCFTGPRQDVERLYAGADVLLVPSIQEAFGNVVLEGLAAGLPVVTTRRVGAAELLEGPLLELVGPDPADLDDFHRRICRALDHAPELREAARRRAEELPWSAHFVALGQLLARAAAEARGARDGAAGMPRASAEAQHGPAAPQGERARRERSP